MEVDEEEVEELTVAGSMEKIGAISSLHTIIRVSFLWTLFN